MKREQLAPVFTVSKAGLMSLLPIKALLTTAPRGRDRSLGASRAKPWRSYRESRYLLLVFVHTYPAAQVRTRTTEEM